MSLQAARDAQAAAYEHAVALEPVPSHRANLRANRDEYRQWRAGGYQGNFHGKLLW